MKRIFTKNRHILTTFGILLLMSSCNVIKTMTNGETQIEFNPASSLNTSCIKPSPDANSISLSSGLTEFFHFDEIAGNRNGVLSQMNLVETGSVSSTSGICGKALDTGTMNNSNELVPTPNTNLAFGTNDFSIAFWVKFDPASAGYQYFMGDDDNVSMDMYIGFYNNGSNISFEVWMAGPNSVMNLSNVFVPDESWHHVAVVFDRDTTTKFYLDGVEYHNTAATTSSANLTDVANERLGGRHYYGTMTPIIGAIDELGIWSRVLTPGEISKLHALEYNF